MDKQVDQFIETLNRGAEEAAKQAAPIFVSAIKQMTINDAWNILKGDKDAATQYLQKTTTSQLETKFKPVIQKALDKVNATKYYGDLVNTYNKIPFVDKVNPDLNDYATTLAIDGLFKLVAQEEANIRSNPGARTTELLKKVFKEQDNWLQGKSWKPVKSEKLLLNFVRVCQFQSFYIFEIIDISRQKSQVKFDGSGGNDRIG